MNVHPHFPTCIYIKEQTQISDFIHGGMDDFCLPGIVTKYLKFFGKYACDQAMSICKTEV